jgi:hypothetical protein
MSWLIISVINIAVHGVLLSALVKGVTTFMFFEYWRHFLGISLFLLEQRKYYMMDVFGDDVVVIAFREQHKGKYEMKHLESMNIWD